MNTNTPDYPVNSSGVTMGDTSGMDLGPLFDAVEAGRNAGAEVAL